MKYDFQVWHKETLNDVDWEPLTRFSLEQQPFRTGEHISFYYGSYTIHAIEFSLSSLKELHTPKNNEYIDHGLIEAMEVSLYVITQDSSGW